MTTFNIPLPQLQLFFLIFLRVISILMTAPFFDSKNIPLIFKAGLCFMISILLFPALRLNKIPLLIDVIPFGIGVIGEIILGITIGLSVKLIFAGVQLAGQLAGFQMGIAIANVMDPATSGQIPVLAQFNNLVAMLIFLSTNAHHWFLRTLIDSFKMVPPLSFHFNTSLFEQLMVFASRMFMIAVKIGAPIMASMMLASVALGLIARTVPQMNIFIVAMPIKIVLGLLCMGFALPFFASYLIQLFNQLGNTILFLLEIISL
jgi:flagellar biosynthetic protein FliR